MAKEQRQAPPISQALLDYLDKTFPDRAPSPQMHGREVWITVGKVEVVRHLKQVFKNQTTPKE